MKRVIVLLASLLVPLFAFASGAEVKLDKAPINVNDKLSLQRGTQLFVNNCLGCHSAKYLRYERVATDLGIPNDIMLANLAFTSDKIGDPMVSAMTKAQGKQWFGNPPPDLSLIARVRGADWVYSYLTGFYPDPKRPYGVNNHVFKDVGMPHVLSHMEKSLGEKEFKSKMADLTNFLVYAAEPIRATREHLGVKVLVFILLFGAVCYFLNKEYWKDVH